MREREKVCVGQIGLLCLLCAAADDDIVAVSLTSTTARKDFSESLLPLRSKRICELAADRIRSDHSSIDLCALFISLHALSRSILHRRQTSSAVACAVCLPLHSLDC